MLQDTIKMGVPGAWGPGNPQPHFEYISYILVEMNEHFCGIVAWRKLWQAVLQNSISKMASRIDIQQG